MMKKITNQKIDIYKLFERYMTYVYSLDEDIKNPHKRALKYIKDYMYNEQLIKHRFDIIFRYSKVWTLEPKSYYDLELKLSIRGF